MRAFPPGVHLKGGQVAADRNRRGATAFYASLLAPVAAWRRQGLSLRAIAAELTRMGVETRYGCGGWNPMQVGRILARAQQAGLSVDSDQS